MGVVIVIVANQDIVNKQDEIPGQRKEVNVEDYGEASSIAQILKDLDFPANKNKIYSFIMDI